MRGEDLINEGQSLLRPSLELTTEPSDETAEPSSQRPVGTWRAQRSLAAPDGETLEHVISINCEWLKSQFEVWIDQAGRLSATARIT